MNTNHPPLQVNTRVQVTEGAWKGCTGIITSVLPNSAFRVKLDSGYQTAWYESELKGICPSKPGEQNDPTNATDWALVGECDTCGNITAFDIDATPENQRAMETPGRTVKRLPKDEALTLWQERGYPCDHKALIAHLRAQLKTNPQ